jgi:hypothetical protein
MNSVKRKSRHERRISTGEVTVAGHDEATVSPNCTGNANCRLSNVSPRPLTKATLEGLVLKASLVGEQLRRGIIDAPTATIELHSLTQLMIGGL